MKQGRNEKRTRVGCQKKTEPETIFPPGRTLFGVGGRLRLRGATVTLAVGLAFFVLFGLSMVSSAALATPVPAYQQPEIPPPPTEDGVVLSASADGFAPDSTDAEYPEKGRDRASLQIALPSVMPSLHGDAARHTRAAFNAISGTVLLSETFATASGSTPPAGWVNNLLDGEAGVDTWRFDNPGSRAVDAPFTEPVAIFDSDAISNNDKREEVSLDSPTFDASAYGYVGLRFDHYFRNQSGRITVDVYDGNEWHIVYSTTDETPAPEQKLIDVSEHLAGVANAQIDFRFAGNWDYYWMVDNVEVFGLAQAPLDLVLSSSAPSSVSEGVVFTLHHTVTNSSNDVAPSVVLTSTLPEGGTYLSGSPSCNAPDAQGRVLCELGALSEQASQGITISVQAPNFSTNVENSAEVGTSASDIDISNNKTSNQIVVLPTSPADRYVTTTGADATNCADSNAPCRTVSFAALNAYPGDTVYVAAGVYTETVQVARSLVIRGEGSNQTILDGEKNRQVIRASAPLQLVGLSVINGKTSDKGGGIISSQPLTLTRVQIAYNESGDQGGGLFSVNSVSISNTQFISNVSVDRGGAAYILGELTMAESLVQENRCLGKIASIFIIQQCHGGGLFVYNNVTIIDSRFISNTSLIHAGGGVFGQTYEHTITLRNVEFIGNKAGNNGGGAYFHGNLVADNVRFEQNRAGVCGGAFFSNSSVTISNSQLIQNESESLGGGGYVGSKWARSEVRLANVLVEGNRSNSSGGGVFVAPEVISVEIAQSRFYENQADTRGGAISVNPSIPVTITDSQLHGNRTIYGQGGAAFLQTGPNVLSGLSVMSNTTTSTWTSYSLGGGIYLNGNLIMKDSVFAHNSADRGGGLYLAGIEGDDQASLTNLLLNDNLAREQGAGIYISDKDYVQIAHTTIAAAKQMTTTAIYVAEQNVGTIGITNTIVANHAVGIQRSGGTVHEDYNLLFGNGTDRMGEMDGGVHSIQADPLFINPIGGDYRLGAGSPAQDAGMDMGIAHDLDRVARPQGDGVDIGAYESQHQPAVAQHDIYLPLVEQ